MKVLRYPIIGCESLSKNILNWFKVGSKKHKQQKTNKYSKEESKKIYNYSNSKDYDLINNEGDKIEIKTTRSRYIYNNNSFIFHTKNQLKQKIMKFLVDDSEINQGKIIIYFDIIEKKKGIYKSILNKYLSQLK